MGVEDEGEKIKESGRVIAGRSAASNQDYICEKERRGDRRVRAVPSPKNQRKEPTVQTGREGSPDPKFWSSVPFACNIHGGKPNSSRRKTVLNVGH